MGQAGRGGQVSTSRCLDTINPLLSPPRQTNLQTNIQEKATAQPSPAPPYRSTGPAHLDVPQQQALVAAVGAAGEAVLVARVGQVVPAGRQYSFGRQVLGKAAVPARIRLEHM